MSLRGRARPALLEAAAACIHERGFAATTQSEVLARCGANPRSITYHFGSFERLRAQALTAIFRERAERVTRAETLGDFEAAFVEALATLTEDPAVALALPEALAQARSPELREVFAEHYAELRDRLRAAIERTTGDAVAQRGGDAGVLAAALLALVDGLVLQWLLDPRAVPDGRAVLESLAAGFSLAAEQGSA